MGGAGGIGVGGTAFGGAGGLGTGGIGGTGGPGGVGRATTSEGVGGAGFGGDAFASGGLGGPGAAGTGISALESSILSTEKLATTIREFSSGFESKEFGSTFAPPPALTQSFGAPASTSSTTNDNRVTHVNAPITLNPTTMAPGVTHDDIVSAVKTAVRRGSLNF